MMGDQERDLDPLNERLLAEKDAQIARLTMELDELSNDTEVLGKCLQSANERIEALTAENAKLLAIIERVAP